MITLELKKEDFANAEVFEGVLDTLGIDEDHTHLIEEVRIHIKDRVIITSKREPDNEPDFDTDDQPGGCINL